MNECKGVPMSDWEWDGIVNDPVRQEAADYRHMDEQERRADREERLCQFRERSTERKKKRVEIEACRYTIGMLAAGILAYICGANDISWLAWVLGSAAGVLGIIACFGFGRAYEMGRR